MEDTGQQHCSLLMVSGVVAPDTMFSQLRQRYNHKLVGTGHEKSVTAQAKC